MGQTFWKMEGCIHEKTYTWLFRAALFISTKNWKELKCLLTDKWKNKPWHIHMIVDLHSLEISKKLRKTNLSWINKIYADTNISLCRQKGEWYLRSNIKINTVLVYLLFYHFTFKKLHYFTSLLSQLSGFFK